ncbi:MAG TPA: Holliday junction branch migration protein RuvA, partial [Anaerolineae bacterium]
MIARLRGTVLSIKPPAAVIDVAGVGFRVSCSQAALDTLDAGRVSDLYTHLIVREDELSLYGFANDEEVNLFQMLLTVSGIGPRTGLAVLSKLQPEALRTAIVGDRADIISRVPGIGKKTAEKIIFALKDKLGGLDAAPSLPASAMDAEVISALTSLGYSIAE